MIWNKKLSNQIRSIAELELDNLKHKSAKVVRKLDYMNQAMDTERLNQSNLLRKTSSNLGEEKIDKVISGVLCRLPKKDNEKFRSGEVKTRLIQEVLLTWGKISSISFMRHN